MMLGAINPMGAVPVSFGQPQTFSQGQTQSTITIPANQRQYYQTPQPNPSPVLPAKEEQQQQTDYLAMAKKYAPYVIGAVVLYYLILKNK